MKTRTYLGYKINTNDAGEVTVFDPRVKREAPVYRTSSVARAEIWTRAYLRGENWAVSSRETSDAHA